MKLAVQHRDENKPIKQIHFWLFVNDLHKISRDKNVLLDYLFRMELEFTVFEEVGKSG